MELSDELIKLIYTQCGQYSYMSNKRQYRRNSDSKMFSQKDAATEIVSQLALDHSTLYTPIADQKEQIIDYVADTLKSVAEQKKKKQTKKVVSNSVASTYSTGLDTKLVENPMWKPASHYNLIDADWCANLVTDKNGVLYKKKANGGYEIIGTTGGRGNTSIAMALSRKQPIPDVFAYIKNQVDILSGVVAKIKEYEVTDMTELMKLEIQVAHDADGNPVKQTFGEYVGLPVGQLPDNIDNAISLVVYKFINTRLPASPFYGKLTLKKYYNIFHDDDGKERPVFQGFVARSGDGTALTAQSYFENVLDNYLGDLGRIDDRPVSVSNDNDVPAFGVFNQKQWDEDEEKYGYLTYATSELVKTFLDPMDKDQRRFVCAWLYAVFFHLNAIISILHQDKGGTLKTTIKQILREMIRHYYDADITFILKLDQLCDKQFLYDSKRMLSIADALFVDYDEPPTKGIFWEEVKAKTGGAKVDIPIKELYANPYTITGSPLFYIGSNKTCFLPDKGAFKRRLACIITTANETWKKIPLDHLDRLNNDIEYQKPEFHLLMKLGKEAYEQIKSEYGSLAEASVRMPSIASQLDALSPWDEYCERFYLSLFKDTEVVKLANDAIDLKLDEWKVKHRTTLKIDHMSIVNYFKMVHPDNVTKPFKINGQTVRGWILHKINPVVEGAEEASFQELGLDADGDPIPSIPMPVNSIKFQPRKNQDDINVINGDPDNPFMEM